MPELIDPLGLTATMIGQWIGLPSDSVAFVLQGMHPTIRQVVDEYSEVRVNPAARAIRSFDAVQQWYFGGKASIEQGYWLRRMHRPLQMTGSDGKHLSALEPEAYSWVIETAFCASSWVAPKVLGRPLTEAEHDEIFADTRLLARLLQVPEREFPATREEFWQRFHRLAKERLDAGDIVDLIDGRLPSSMVTTGQQRQPFLVRKIAMPMAAKISRVMFVAVMPPDVRAELGLWASKSDEKALDRFFAAYRVIVRILPERITYTPIAYHARNQQRQVLKMRRRERKSFTAYKEQRDAKAAARRSGCPM